MTKISLAIGLCYNFCSRQGESATELVAGSGGAGKNLGTLSSNAHQDHVAFLESLDVESEITKRRTNAACNNHRSRLFFHVLLVFASATIFVADEVRRQRSKVFVGAKLVKSRYKNFRRSAGWLNHNYFFDSTDKFNKQNKND